MYLIHSWQMLIIDFTLSPPPPLTPDSCYSMAYHWKKLAKLKKVLKDFSDCWRGGGGVQIIVLPWVLIFLCTVLALTVFTEMKNLLSSLKKKKIENHYFYYLIDLPYSLWFSVVLTQKSCIFVLMYFVIHKKNHLYNHLIFTWPLPVP